MEKLKKNKKYKNDPKEHDKTEGSLKIKKKEKPNKRKNEEGKISFMDNFKKNKDDKPNKNKRIFITLSILLPIFIILSVLIVILIRKGYN